MSGFQAPSFRQDLGGGLAGKGSLFALAFDRLILATRLFIFF